MAPSYHIEISGKVQGVFFRNSSKNIADKLGIKGWVRNRKNGQVEILISGNDKNINKFIGWAKRGPEKAEVSVIKIKKITEYSQFENYSIYY